MNVEVAIAVLRASGYEVGDVVAQYTAREYWSYFQTPRDTEILYGRLNNTVRSFEDKVPVLSVNSVKVGYQITLTPGQRAVLRNDYDLTPTKNLVVLEVEVYSAPYRDIIRAVTLQSMLPSETRKHVLSLCRIERFGEFLKRASDCDKEFIEDREAKQASKSNTKTNTTKSKQSAVDEIAAEYV